MVQFVDFALLCTVRAFSFQVISQRNKLLQVLSNRRVSTGGLPDTGLRMLCPNVTDLDLSSNLLESWAELLPLLSELHHLKFLNLSRNHITRHKVVNINRALKKNKKTKSFKGGK